MRIAIIVSKSLSAGMAANSAAILCGQLAAMKPDFFGADPILDGDGRKHAAIHHNVVLLRANGGEQLINTADALKDDAGLTVLLFSEFGQETSNNFELYKAGLNAGTSRELRPVAILVAGPDDRVRVSTRKFSVLT